MRAHSFGSHGRAAATVLFVSTFLGAASVLAAPPHAEVGAMLRAGAALDHAVRGRRVVAVRALPGSLDGYVVAVGRRDASAASREERIARDGLAYPAGDTIAIASVRVSRRRIEVLFGDGGYDRESLETPGKPGPSGVGRDVSRQVINEHAGESDPTERELSEHQLAQRRTQYAYGREETARQHDEQLRHERARTSGARVRLQFARDLVPGELTESNLAAWLAPHARLLEVTAPVPGGERR